MEGLREVLWRTYLRCDEDRLLAVAAGVSFYTILALFPGLSAFVALYGLFADRTALADHLSLIADIAPPSAYEIITGQIEWVMRKGSNELGIAFAVSFGLALWSANAGMKAIMDALNVAYEEKERRGWIKFNAESLVFTIGCIVGLLLAVIFVVVLPLMLSYVGLDAFTESIIFYGRWPMLVFLLTTFLSTLYRYGPSRQEAKWRWLTPGGVVAALLWLAGSFLLSWYLENIADYDAVYGTFGAAIGLMMWLWLSAIAVLFGAELNAEIER
jgi:membrane protein